MDSPLKSPKNDTRLDLPANPPRTIKITRLHRVTPIIDRSIVQIVIQHRQRDKGREPEQHGQRIEGEDGEDVGEGGEEARGQGEVDEYKEGPDGGKEHEIYPGRGVGGQGRDCGGRDQYLGIKGVRRGHGGWLMQRGRKGRERHTMAGETDDYDREEELEGADDEDDGVEHDGLAGWLKSLKKLEIQGLNGCLGRGRSVVLKEGTGVQGRERVNELLINIMSLSSAWPASPVP